MSEIILYLIITASLTHSFFVILFWMLEMLKRVIYNTRKTQRERIFLEELRRTCPQEYYRLQQEKEFNL